jgi:poly(3-hydroxybutyrate) depolymerase
LKLPVNYDPKRAYPINIAGGGCGGDEFSGQNGGLTALPNGQSEAIQVGLSYVYSGGACFEDNHVNSPDLPYFDAVLKDVQARYCTDKSKVFVSGFSSGAWEAFMLGCSRAGTVRAIGTAAGGLRLTRPPCSGVPIAAMMVAGIRDEDNPIGPLTEPKHDSYGSAPSRDEILLRNGCVGNENVPWDPAFPDCVKYTGCPAAFPVVWCAIDDGHSSGHPNGGANYSGEGFWKFWMSLPPIP